MPDPLFSELDVQERLGRQLTAVESNRVQALIRDASANIRRVSTQTFTLVTDDVVTLRRSKAGRVRLPQRPVVSIASVKDVNGNALPYTRSGEWLNVSGCYLNAWELNLSPYSDPISDVVVTYTHGGDVPDQIIAVGCSIVGRALGTPPDETGTVQIGVDGFSETLGSAAASGGLGMLASELEICQGFARTGSPISMLS